MQNCLRCNNEIEKNESGLCGDCEAIVNEALLLVETNPEVSKFYEKAISDQKKAAIRLEKVKHQYNNVDKESLLKKTGKGIAKVYHFSFLDLVTKKLKSNNTTQEDGYIEEILELEEFISTDPIEFVIYEYIIPEEEKTIENHNDKSKNFLVNAYSLSMRHLLGKLDQKKQIQFSIAFIVIVAIFLSIITFL